MNKMATVLRENLHLLTADGDASPDDTAAPAARLDRVHAQGSGRGERLNVRNPFSSDPPPALRWSVRHFGLAGLLGGALVSRLLRLVRGSRD
jgi:hypothetical protein